MTLLRANRRLIWFASVILICIAPIWFAACKGRPTRSRAEVQWVRLLSRYGDLVVYSDSGNVIDPSGKIIGRFSTKMKRGRAFRFTYTGAGATVPFFVLRSSFKFDTFAPVWYATERRRLIGSIDDPSRYHGTHVEPFNLLMASRMVSSHGADLLILRMLLARELPWRFDHEFEEVAVKTERARKGNRLVLVFDTNKDKRFEMDLSTGLITAI